MTHGHRVLIPAGAVDRPQISVGASAAESIHRIALVLLCGSVVSIAVAGASDTATASDPGTAM